MKRTATILFFVTAILLSSCAPSAPQADALGVETIVALTYNAIAAQTEAARPLASATPLVTATVTNTVIPTATVTYTPTFVLPSITPSPTITPTPSATPGRFDCAFVSQSPNNGASFAPREEFKLTWTVRNIGDKGWIQTDVKYFFVSGEKFHKREIYGIPHTTQNGQEVVMKIDMVAPRASGSYETTWAMKRGLNNIFCERTFKFTVE